MRDLLAGTITATTLHETTAPDGNRAVVVPQFGENGRPLPPLVVNVPLRRLLTLAYDDPRGPNGGGPRDPRDDDPPGGGPRDRGNP